MKTSKFIENRWFGLLLPLSLLLAVACENLTDDLNGDPAAVDSWTIAGPLPFEALSLNDNGDGTVTDENTGLVWQRADDGIRRNWAAAGFYCENLTLAGKSDWRLPNVRELLSVVDHSKYDPAAPSALDTRSAGYWSSTVNAGDFDQSWFVYFESGTDGNWNDRSNHAYARCVSGAVQSLTLESLTLADGESAFRVKEAKLTFTGTEDLTLRNWAAAGFHCENLTYGGKSDWRLPTLKELTLLVDYSKSAPASRSALGMNSSFYWSSTADADDDEKVWNVRFGDGYGIPNSKSANNRVRCVSG